MFQEGAYALHKLHTRNIIHRDIKPANLFFLCDVAQNDLMGGNMAQKAYEAFLSLDRDKISVKIGDFGLSKVLNISDDSQFIGSSVHNNEDFSIQAIGSPLYMPPEQWKGLNQADQRSDIYAFGAVMYHLLSGSPPFSGNVAKLKTAHESQKPKPIDGVPKPFMDILYKCLEKDPEKRYQDAKALGDDLGNMGGDLVSSYESRINEFRSKKQGAEERIGRVMQVIGNYLDKMERARTWIQENKEIPDNTEDIIDGGYIDRFEKVIKEISEIDGIAKRIEEASKKTNGSVDSEQIDDTTQNLETSDNESQITGTKPQSSFHIPFHIFMISILVSIFIGIISAKMIFKERGNNIQPDLPDVQTLDVIDVQTSNPEAKIGHMGKTLTCKDVLNQTLSSPKFEFSEGGCKFARLPTPSCPVGFVVVGIEDENGLCPAKGLKKGMEIGLKGQGEIRDALRSDGQLNIISVEDVK